MIDLPNHPGLPIHRLRKLARSYRIQTSYRDVFGRTKQATADALLATLRALGAPVEKLDDVPSALREKNLLDWQKMLEPVSVAWDGETPKISVRLSSRHPRSKLGCQILLENGDENRLFFSPDQITTEGTERTEGTEYFLVQISLPKLPFGYHRLHLEVNGEVAESLLISAPSKMFNDLQKLWGVFLPMYAFHTNRSWGAGDFSDFETLMHWIAQQGGGVLSTLPFLASFLDGGIYDHSPYSPASRLFWNEFYIDPERAPEFANCSAAQSLLASGAFQKEIQRLREEPLIDYRSQMAAKRRVLEELARRLEDNKPDRYQEFHSHVKSHPWLQDYAEFRAVIERQQTPWPQWSERLRNGVIGENDYDQQSKHYHLYVQWLAETQVRNLADGARKSGVRLYLDFPLGVNRDGYDVWRHRDLFALDASGGAPVDLLFTKGQNWGFPPLHPEKIREQGYTYLIACLRHQMAHAGMLRVDHIMGLHRLYWIPKGISTEEGVYVRYRAEETYAILGLESHRFGVPVVGEDLGVVPDYVRTSMDQHGALKMNILQCMIQPGASEALAPVTENSVASLNTHDMPPFTAFLRGSDIQDRIQHGLLQPHQVNNEYDQRWRMREALAAYLCGDSPGARNWDEPDDLLRRSIEWLAQSSAQVVLINFEDLWFETEPQNIPATSWERPNWRRKARYCWEDFPKNSRIRDIFQMMRNIRPRR